MTIPNALSTFRLAAAPVLLILAWYDQEVAFLILLVLALCSDAMDGYLARKWHQTSELGNFLDSLGDFVIYISLMPSAWWLWPEIIEREATYVGLALTALLLPAAVGLLKYRQVPCYHTLGAKFVAVLMSIAALLLFALDYPWPFRVVVGILLLASTEEILITLVLPACTGNVLSLWHALRLRREMRRN